MSCFLCLNLARRTILWYPRLRDVRHLNSSYSSKNLYMRLCRYDMCSSIVIFTKSRGCKLTREHRCRPILRLILLVVHTTAVVVNIVNGPVATTTDLASFIPSYFDICISWEFSLFISFWLLITRLRKRKSFFIFSLLNFRTYLLQNMHFLFFYNTY